MNIDTMLLVSPILLWSAIFVPYVFALDSDGTCSSTGAFKVVTELLSYTNLDCVLSDGTRFNNGEDCPIKLYVHLDGFDPDAPQKSELHEIEYSAFLATTEKEIVFLPVQTGARVIARDFCDEKFRGANLRVIILQDGKTEENHFRHKLVNSYSCKIPKTEAPTPLHEDTKWSSMTPCLPLHDAKRMGLTFRYQIYQVPLSQCCLS